jgi:electron transport complex protein RnfG
MSTEQKPDSSGVLSDTHPALFNAIKLGVFAVVAALVLGSTYSSTADRIAASQLAVEQRALLEVVEQIDDKKVDLADRLWIQEGFADMLNIDPTEAIQIVRDSDANAVAFIVPTTAPDGYSGAIRLLVGVDLKAEITGVRAIEHRETPGLGDKVDIKKSDWIQSFIGKSLDNPLNGWAVKKDGGEFDAFTGATITPRAVVAKVESVLQFYNQYSEELLEQSSNNPEVDQQGEQIP